jgi:hypothetical protein
MPGGDSSLGGLALLLGALPTAPAVGLYAGRYSSSAHPYSALAALAAGVSSVAGVGGDGDDDDDDDVFDQEEVMLFF